MNRYTAVIGFNSKQPWIYDEEKDVYVDVPICVLEALPDWRENPDEAERVLEDIANKEKPDWLNDEEYWLDGDIDI